MEYLKIKLKNGKKAFALKEYYPYTDKLFFKSLDDILSDETLQMSLAYLFAELYKDELTFEFDNVDKHRYIVPIVHRSNKFTKINKLIAYHISKVLKIVLVDDFFDELDIPYVDIRDEYTKKEGPIKIRINSRYEGKSIILFDCCCSTGTIIDSLLDYVGDNNLFLCYGVRYNAYLINNTCVEDINNCDIDVEQYMSKNPGYFIRIYGLFGCKDVEVDFRYPFSICIGENGFGKSTSIRIALLALNVVNDENDFSNSKEYAMKELAHYYFERIEVYYSDYFYDEKEIMSNKHKVKFFNKDGDCFYQQIIEDGCTINCDDLKKIGIYDSLQTKIDLDEKINSDKNIFLKELKLNYQFIKEKYSFVSALKMIIRYKDLVLSKERLIEKCGDKSLNKFIKTIDEEEYYSLIRKILLDDRSIMIDYNDLNIKYDGQFNYNKIDSLLRKVFKNHSMEENDYLINEKYYYFNCAKSRNIIQKPPRERIRIDYFDDDELSNQMYENIYNEYKHELDDDLFDDNHNDKTSENKDSKEKYLCAEHTGNFKENFEFTKPFYENIENIYIKALNDYKKISVFDSNQSSGLFDSKDIILHNVLHWMFLSDDKLTNIYSILKMIIEIDGMIFNSDRITLYINDSEKKITLSLKNLLSTNNKNIIKKEFDEIFKTDYDIISFGIYDILNNEDFNILSTIIKRLRNKGLKDEKDYLILVGIKLMIDSYKNKYITEKNILLEKLLNKYLINKRVHVLANSLVIVDNNEKYVPINCLSTGERNLIIIICFCLSERNKFIILDEPDLSMSIDWQSKILVDLLKYTKNEYMIISQSPLLVQKNHLAPFIKRLDYFEELTLVDYEQLKILSKIINEASKENANGEDNEFFY